MKLYANAILIIFMVSRFCFSAVPLATVNGKVITEQDLEQALEGMQEGHKKNILSDRMSREQLLMSVIEQELLVKKAVEKKFDQTDEYKRAMEGFRKKFLGELLLQKELGAKVTQKALKSYYDDHKRRYTTDSYHIQHILLSTLEEAKEIAKKVKEPEADFQAMAEKHSKDPSAKNNRGDLGFMDINSPFVTSFKDAVIGATKGKILGPVKTAFGYHIIKIIERKDGRKLNYDEVEYLIQNELKKQLRDDYLDELREKAKIEYSAPKK
ncbi:MAG: peptidylprolyl isomerase [Bdellovibrio sp.]|nr:peptidylprolyl isomerase [Bdellovibrio sp.]